MSEVSSWGRSEFKAPTFGVTLLDVTKDLSPSAKQAMYTAAQKGLIARGTWDGCAFNAGGEVVGRTDVASFAKAAEVFDMEPKKVSRFIGIWDRYQGTDKEATNALIFALEKVGLHSTPEDFKENGKPKMRVVMKRVFTSEETKLKEEFDAMVSELDIEEPSEEQEELVHNTKGVAELLNA